MAEARKVWAITEMRGAIVLRSMRTTRALCIHDYVRLPGNKSVDRTIAKRWRKMHAWGWRCVPVWITTSEPHPAGGK